MPVHPWRAQAAMEVWRGVACDHEVSIFDIHQYSPNLGSALPFYFRLCVMYLMSELLSMEWLQYYLPQILCWTVCGGFYTVHLQVVYGLKQIRGSFRFASLLELVVIEDIICSALTVMLYLLMWPYPRKIASCVCPFYIAFCRLQYREPIRRLTIYLVQLQIPAYRLKLNCRCMQWRKVVTSPRYRRYVNAFHYVIGENSKILLVEFSLWIWQGKRKAKANITVIFPGVTNPNFFLHI